MRKDLHDAMIMVGQPHKGDRSQRAEGPRYNFRDGRHILELFLNGPTPAETAYFNQDSVEMALWNDPPVIWIILKFEHMGWFDAPYTIHRVEPELRTFPELDTKDTRYPVTMILADAKDGTVAAIRCITMSPGLTREFDKAARLQLDRPYSEDEFDRRINGVYREFRATEQMLERASIFEIMGQNEGQNG